MGGEIGQLEGNGHNQLGKMNSDNDGNNNKQYAVEILTSTYCLLLPWIL